MYAIVGREETASKAGSLSTVLDALLLPNGMTVAEVECGDDLSEEPSCFLGSQSALLHQVVEQLSTGDVL